MTDFSNSPDAQRPRENEGFEPSQQLDRPFGSPPTPPTAQPFPGQPSPMGHPPAAGAVSTGTRGLYTAAAVLNWITLALVGLFTFGIGFIAAAWYVPMTILIHKAAKGPYKHTGLGVCTLLFCNLIAGILMLVDDSNRPAKPV